MTVVSPSPEVSATPPNVYKFPPAGSRRRARGIRLFVCGVLVGVAGAGLFAYYLSINRLHRWLPERPGEAVVVEKINHERGGRYELRVRVEVPGASPEEAALVPQEYLGREAVISARQLEDVVATSEGDWTAVDQGTRLRASYQINVLRDRVLVRSLYLDHLDSN